MILTPAIKMIVKSSTVVKTTGFMVTNFNSIFKFKPFKKCSVSVTLNSKVIVTCTHMMITNSIDNRNDVDTIISTDR